jgi:hypothetical protein
MAWRRCTRKSLVLDAPLHLTDDDYVVPARVAKLAPCLGQGRVVSRPCCPSAREDPMSAPDVLIIKCNADGLDELSALLRDAEATVQASPQRHLDGEQVKEWIIVAIAAGQTAPVILDSLRRFLTRNNLESVTYGDVELKNPRPEDLAELASAIARARGREH